MAILHEWSPQNNNNNKTIIFFYCLAGFSQLMDHLSHLSLMVKGFFYPCDPAHEKALLLLVDGHTSPTSLMEKPKLCDSNVIIL